MYTGRVEGSHVSTETSSDHCCLQLVTGIGLVYPQLRLTCETLPAESKCIVDTDHGKEKTVLTIESELPGIRMDSDQNAQCVDE